MSALIIIVEQINTLQVHVHVSIKYFTQIKQLEWKHIKIILANETYEEFEDTKAIDTLMF